MKSKRKVVFGELLLIFAGILILAALLSVVFYAGMTAVLSAVGTTGGAV